MNDRCSLEIPSETIIVDKKCKMQTSTSSKGNQIKWRKGNVWLKADDLGYEGLAEVMASSLAHFTDLPKFAPVVDYTLCTIVDENGTRHGCKSFDFMPKGYSLVTLNRVLSNVLTAKELRDFKSFSVEGKIKCTVDVVVSATGIKNFGEWLSALLEFDHLILNEDRHTNNIAVLSNGTDYKLMPLFDNGASFFSDCKIDYSLDKGINICRKAIKSKPFSSKFEKQVEVCKRMFGSQLNLTLRDEDLNENVMDGIELYSDREKLRVMNVLHRQLRLWGCTKNAQI